MTDSPKGAWLQVTGRAPKQHKTKGAAMAELKEQADRAEERGWRRILGSRTAGHVAFEKDGEKRAIVVTLVDAEGYEVEGRERTGRRMKGSLLEAFGL